MKITTSLPIHELVGDCVRIRGLQYSPKEYADMVHRLDDENDIDRPRGSDDALGEDQVVAMVGELGHPDDPLVESVQWLSPLTLFNRTNGCLRPRDARRPLNPSASTLMGDRVFHAGF